MSADPTGDPPLLVLTDRLGTLALDLDDGTEQWRIEADPTAPTGTRAHGVSASSVILIERDGVVRGYDRATGRWQWLAPLPGAVQIRHARDHDDLVVVTADAVGGSAGAVRLAAAFDRATGERRWQRRSANLVLSAVGPVSGDGSGRVRLLDPTDGDVRREVELTHPIATLAAVGPLAVAAGWEGTSLVDLDTGGIVLELEVGARLLHRDREVAVLLGDEELIAIREDGTWWRSATGPVGSGPRVGVTDDAIWLRDREGGSWRFDRDGVLVRTDRTDPGSVELTGPLELRPRAAARGAEFAPLRIREILGPTVATTPPGNPVAAVRDGAIVAGSGWLVRLRAPDGAAPASERTPPGAPSHALAD